LDSGLDAVIVANGRLVYRRPNADSHTDAKSESNSNSNSNSESGHGM
jgi:hypothetical protein